jgi:hypothetical protein
MIDGPGLQPPSEPFPASALRMAARFASRSSPFPVRPGFSPGRFRSLIREAVLRTGLDLRGLNVLTEAATGAYGATAVIAAAAGANVHALARPSRYGSVGEIRDWVGALADTGGVADRISIIDEVPRDVWAAADIVTNSGHLRPITAESIGAMRPDAVIGLMFEAWEFRDADLDLAACRQRGIRVAGINERHESVDVFSFLGVTCVKMLFDAGISVYGNRIALLCDNDFGPFIVRGLTGLGARVRVFDSVRTLPQEAWHAVICALRPAAAPRIGSCEARRLARVAPDAVVVQFWGDIDRSMLAKARISVWPEREPAPGHMAGLLDQTGPEAVVRLQAGGMLAAQRVFRGGSGNGDSLAQLL